MDLYDDLDTKHRPGQIDGWSSGIRLLPQLALKKAPPPVKKEQLKRPAVSYYMWNDEQIEMKTKPNL